MGFIRKYDCKHTVGMCFYTPVPDFLYKKATSENEIQWNEPRCRVSGNFINTTCLVVCSCCYVSGFFEG